MKISVITPNYTLNGVPISQIRLANALAAKGHEIELLIGYIDPSYSFPETPSVSVHHLNRRHARGMFWPLVKHFREFRPDLVFSAEDHLNAFVLLAALVSGSKAKLSCSSHVTPFDTYRNRFKHKAFVLKRLMKILMHRADALTCVSQGMVEEYRQIFEAPKHCCVYNIIDYAGTRAMMEDPLDEPWLIANDNLPVLIAAGRLEPCKGFDNLLLAMKELLKTRQAKLLILGDGICRAELEAMISEHGLDKWVKMPGYVSNPLKYFHKADVFVLSSRLEGLGNVLVEAMMCGCTPVSTDCPTGPKEVLGGGKYGYLVPVDDPFSMASAIAKAIDVPISDATLSEAIKPFAEDAVINRHFEVLGLTMPSFAASNAT